VHQKGCKEIFFVEYERVIDFVLNHLVDGVVIRVKGRAPIVQTTIGSMKAIWCSEAKSLSTYALQEESIVTTDFQSMLRQMKNY
jgi:hypothetical protein